MKEYYASHKNLRKILGTGYRNYYDYYRQYGRFGDGSEKAKQGIRIYSTTVCIDPGHQRRAMYSREPIGPGSGTYKIKVSSGTYGRACSNSESNRRSGQEKGEHSWNKIQTCET